MVTILVVHPNDEIRQGLAQMVAAVRPEARTIAAESPARALDLARGLQVTVAFVDLDGEGPGAVVTAMGRRPPGEPPAAVVGVTVARNPERMLAAEEAGVAAFIHLPVDAPTVAAVLDAVLDGREA